MIQCNLTSLLALNETWAIHSNDSKIDVGFNSAGFPTADIVSIVSDSKSDGADVSHSLLMSDSSGLPLNTSELTEIVQVEYR